MKRLISRLESNSVRKLRRQVEQVKEMLTKTVANRFSDVLYGMLKNDEFSIKSENTIVVQMDNIELHFICYSEKIIWYCCERGSVDNCYASGCICQSTLIHVTSLENKLNKILKVTRQRNLGMKELEKVV